jgi:hypothetical protein
MHNYVCLWKIMSTIWIMLSRAIHFAHSKNFHVIAIFKSSPKKCWSFIPFFGTQIVSEPFIRKYLLNIHCHASNVDKCWKLLDCDNILSMLYTELAFALSNLLVITTYIYWPIECPPRASFVGVFELARIDVCLLTIWVHSKNS